MTKKGTRYYYDSTKQSATVLQLLQFVLHLSKINIYTFIYLIYKYIDIISFNPKRSLGFMSEWYLFREDY